MAIPLENYQNLIEVFGKLQIIFSKIGDLQEIPLPQLVTVGAQSSGKSSVLEGVVGRDFLPRGTGIVTRTPLQLHCVYTSEDDPIRQDGKYDGDFAIFDHNPNKVYTEFGEVKTEIEARTNFLTENTKNISETPIILKIYSSNLVNLSLVDLPGMVEVPIGGQPTNIKEQVNNLIYNQPNTIILAIIEANIDLANSKTLKHIKNFDPEGERTIIVLTKLDMMNRGTNAMDILMGTHPDVYSKLGVFGVVNRAQEDIEKGKSMEESLKNEEDFLKKHYASVARKHGIGHLTKTLNKIWLNHIREHIPQIKQQIQMKKLQKEFELSSFAKPVADPEQKKITINNILHEYCVLFSNTIERNVCHEELKGGARIYHVFWDKFIPEMNAIEPLKGYKKDHILNAIRNASGTHMAMYTNEYAFILLVESQIKLFKKPCLTCVDLINQELLRVSIDCFAILEQKYGIYPKIMEKMKDVVSKFILISKQPTAEFTEKLIAKEESYINTSHQDFEHDRKNPNFMTEINGSENEKIDDVDLVEVGMDALQYFEKKLTYKTINETIALETPISSQNESESVPESDLDMTNNSTTETKSSNSKAQQNPVCVVSKKVRKPTNGDRLDYLLIMRHVRDYFEIVRKKLQDDVLKSSMMLMVNHVKTRLNNELVSKIIMENPENLDDLLAESVAMAMQRDELTNTLEVLKEGEELLKNLSETSHW